MELDQTHVVIRTRSLSEIGDLAMILIRRYPAAAIFGFAVGAAPWIVLNTLLLGWIPISEFAHSPRYVPATGELNRYLLLMVTLVILQAPLAGVLTTTLIGRAVFEHQVTWRAAIDGLRPIFWRCFWVLGIVRGPLPLMLILVTNWGEPFAVGREGLVVVMWLIWVGFLRALRPFLPEILLLERCPLRSDSPDAITVRRRSSALQAPLAGDLFGRFIRVSFMLAVLAAAVFYTLVWARGVMWGAWDRGLVSYLIFLPLALWAVAGLSVLVRFLSYLDTRIRLEGWEVDLAVRAETQRQIAASPRSGGAIQLVWIAIALATPAMTTIAQEPVTRNADIQSPGIQTPVRQLPIRHRSAETRRHDSPAASDHAAVMPPPSSTPWFDGDGQQFRPVRVVTDLPEAANRKSRWVPRPPPANSRRAPTSTTTPTSGDRSFGTVVGWVVVAVIAFVLVGFLLYTYSQIAPDAAADRDQKRSTSAAIDDQYLERFSRLPSELRGDAKDLRSEVERLMALGRFDQAIVALFGHQLLLLDRGRMLRLARGKTNRRYLHESRSQSPAAYEILGRTVTAFEACYFGEHPPTLEAFAALWEDNLRLESMIRQRLEVAA